MLCISTQLLNKTTSALIQHSLSTKINNAQNMLLIESILIIESQNAYGQLAYFLSVKLLLYIL